MNDDSTWLILVALIGVGLGVLLLSSATPADTGSAVTDTVSVYQTQDQSADKASVYSEELIAPPVVEAGANLTVNEREQVQLHGQAQNVGTGPVSYHWSAEGRQGYFDNAFQRSPVYTAPSICGCQECVTLTLTVTDAQGTSASDRLCVCVLGDPLNCGPVAASRICQEQTRRCVTPSSPGRTYECPSATAPCESPCIRHISVTPTCSEAPLPCCSDPCGCSAWHPSWLGEKTLSAAESPSPLILRRYPDTVNEGTALELYGTVNNRACASVCFCWQANKGWFEDANTLTPIYHAPMSDGYGGEDATITLAIYDEFGGHAYDQIRIHVNNLDYCGSPEASSSNNWLMRGS